MDANVASLLPEVAVAAALAWGAGLRLYLVLFMAGALGRWGGVDLPANLEVLSHPLVLAASGLMVIVEFLADKVPWLDSLWDGVHGFLRIPGGALLAAAVFGDSGEAAMLAAAIVGGTLAAGTHLAKSGSRLAINASPEPFTNWVASVTEEAMVAWGIWAAFARPVLFLALLAVFVLAAGWLLWRLGCGIAALRGRAAGATPPPAEDGNGRA